MKNRYLPILYVGMVLAAFAAGFHALDRLSRSLPRNPSKTRPASALPAEVSETTLSDIRSMLEKQEYHISYDAQKKKLQSPNRAHNLRAYYEPGKLSVQTRVDTTGQGFKVELVNDGVFADGKLLYTPQTNAKAEHHENKVQISHEAFIEEFINNEDGVRQNFIIEKAPESTRQLQVKMTAKGLEVEQGSGNDLRFYSKTADGQTRNELVYSDLKCWDANKQPLNATLAYVDNHIQISVEVANAAYPVTIDPIIVNGTPQNANKVLQIDQSLMWLGFSVSSAGDVNGDGYSDVICGAPHYDLGQDNEGGAFVYKGGASGLTLTAVTFQSNQKDAEMGTAVSTAGDFNGDGFSDVLVGIPYYDEDKVDQGQAMLYLGSGTFFDPQATITSHEFDNDHLGALVGMAVATAGDVDGDGFSDVLIGAVHDSQGQTKEGSVAVCYGSANGNLFSDFTYLQIDQANAKFGYSVASAGDIDADGYSDVIIGARWYKNGLNEDGEGAAFIYKGSGNGLQSSPTVIEGNQYNAAMGNKVSSAGDVNGDGYSDVLVSACLYDVQGVQDNGIVQLYLGSSTGITSQQQPTRTFYGKYNDHMGSSIACAGDVNGDGYSDILLGAEYYDNGQFNEGGVFVYHGSKNGIVGDPVATLESNQIDGWFGTAVSSAGDVNGDGYSDILVGCYTFDNGQKDEGHVFVYHGGAEGVSPTDFSQVTGNVAGAQIGFSVATAGDVNADGYSDVIVGAPYYDLSQGSEGVAFVYYGSQSGLITNTYHVLQENKADSRFGRAVAGAGDINGDGFDDVVVGADNYSNGQKNEGAIFIYHGSAAGITTQAVIHFERNFADSYMGCSVAGAGDVNRDGYADVIVGANGAPNSAYLYEGSIDGITGSPKILQSDQVGESHFGGSVSSAGDVNGDGYGDVIVGDDWYGQNFQGAAYIFHGSNTGIATTAAITLQNNQPNAVMGRSVAGAGDINGDGYSDVIVGAPSYDNGQNNEGVVFVFYGSPAGITNANSVLLEMNKANSGFGTEINCAGDVNGDGYSDIIIGVPEFTDGQQFEGAAYVFHGSPTGIKTSASFQLENTDIKYASMGDAVAGAGDVNGDGYSDIIIGATGYLTGQNTTGSAFVYYGNNGKGLRNNVRLFNGDLVTPLNHNQFSLSNFVATLSAKSFIGRNKGKFVWETMAPGMPFSKVGTNPITTSNLFTGASTFIGMTGISTTLGSNITKSPVATKLRVRVRYSPVLALTGQMYGPWRYLQSQLAGYNNAPVPEEAMAETISSKATAIEAEDAGVSVVPYPNPVSDKLFIKAEKAEQIRSVRFLSPTGKLIYQSQNAAAEVDVSRLDPGIYLLLVTRQDGSQSSHKVIVKK